MFHTPYLALRPIDRNINSSSGSSTGTILPLLGPFIQTHLSIGSEIGCKFLLQNIQSYGTQLVTSNLPPFIHNTALPSSHTQSTLNYGPSAPGTLAICRSIVQLYTTKTSHTSDVVWRTITMEKNRMMDELSTSDEATVLSMLQAITVYILLRIFDEDSFSVKFDRELVRAMTVRSPDAVLEALADQISPKEIKIKTEQSGFLYCAEVEG
jgi:hypothetical protein